MAAKKRSAAKAKNKTKSVKAAAPRTARKTSTKKRASKKTDAS